MRIESREPMLRMRMIKKAKEWLLLQSATRLLQRGKYAASIPGLDRVLELNRDSFEACHNRGIATQYIGKYQDSLKYFDDAIALRPIAPI